MPVSEWGCKFACRSNDSDGGRGGDGGCDGDGSGFGVLVLIMNVGVLGLVNHPFFCHPFSAIK